MVRNKPYDGAAIVEFLQLLLKQQPRKKLLIIWDNASIHNCKATRTFLDTSELAHRLWLAQPPKYCPHLNADEQVWYYLKHKLLKNTCNRNVKELKPKILDAMEKIKANPILVKSFFHHPKLGFYN